MDDKKGHEKSRGLQPNHIWCYFFFLVISLQKLFDPLSFGIGEELFRSGTLDNHTFIQEHHLVRDCTSKVHLMRDDTKPGNAP